LLDNRDDILREVKKIRKELEIDSLKASPVVSDEVECAD
jgi:hypothetical protein